MFGKTGSGSDAQYSEEAVKRIVANALNIAMREISNMDAIKKNRLAVSATNSVMYDDHMELRVADYSKREFQTKLVVINIPALYCMQVE